MIEKSAEGRYGGRYKKRWREREGEDSDSGEEGKKERGGFIRRGVVVEVVEESRI